VVAPPSNHASGGRYSVLLDVPPAEAPGWVVAGLTRPKDLPAPSEAPTRPATAAELDLARRKLAERCAEAALMASATRRWNPHEPDTLRQVAGALRPGLAPDQSRGRDRHPRPAGVLAGAIAANDASATKTSPTGLVPLVDRLPKLGQPKHPTGIAALDRATRGGLRPGTFVGIGGAPGAGKTTLAIQLAVHYARAGVLVAILAADGAPRR